MKIGLDTSVVLRLLTGEPESQARRALDELHALLGHGVVLLASDLVMAEVYFALQHHYDVPKGEALTIMSGFLAESGVTPCGAAAAVLATVSLATANPGFVDRLIYAEYSRLANEVITFEKAGARLPGVRVLPAS
jgi:predicted nucleic-acid-binding protein